LLGSRRRFAAALHSGAAMRAKILLAAWAVLLASGCSSGGDDDDPDGVSGGGSVFGDDPPSSDPDVAERIATRAVNATVSECGGSCSADVGTGYARLREGRMLEAFDAFKCADNPEAAFGAGVARVLGVLESAAGDAVLGDLGYGHLPASDVFGADGWLARLASRWNGQAQLTVTGITMLQLDTDQVSADDYELLVSTHDGARRVQFTIETDTILMPGALLAPQFNCTNGTRVQGSLPSVYLRIRQGDEELSCRVPFSLPVQECVPSGGSLRVVASGDAQGDHVEYELTDLLLACDRHVYDDATSIQPQMTVGLARVTGLVKADVVLEIDTSDLHPIFHGGDDRLLESIPASVSTTRPRSPARSPAHAVTSPRRRPARAPCSRCRARCTPVTTSRSPPATPACSPPRRASRPRRSSWARRTSSTCPCTTWRARSTTASIASRRAARWRASWPRRTPRRARS
jgi:hypothetical protein